MPTTVILYSMSKEWLQSVLAILKETLGEWDLLVNEAKTKWVHFSQQSDQSWKKSKQLGTKLDDEEELKARIALANAAFRTTYTAPVRKKSHLPAAPTPHLQRIGPPCADIQLWHLVPDQETNGQHISLSSPPP